MAPPRIGPTRSGGDSRGPEASVRAVVLLARFREADRHATTASFFA